MKETDKDKAKAIVEALLFISRRPLSAREIRSILEEFPGIGEGTVRSMVEALKTEYAEGGKSFTIVELAGGYQIRTLPEYARWAARLFKGKRRERLSKPALETLAIIAYRQPITRAEIEVIRGVNVDGVMSTLLEKGLIRIRGRKEVVGRPYLYGTSNRFLENFGLKSLDGLPQRNELLPVEEGESSRALHERSPLLSEEKARAEEEKREPRASATEKEEPREAPAGD